MKNTTRHRWNPNAKLWEYRVTTRSWYLGPIPGQWLTQLCQLPAAAIRVGLALWWRAKLTGQPVRLSGEDCEKFAITPGGYSRGLAQLERAGLVQVKRPLGQRAEITIRDPEDARQPDGGTTHG